jgi:hypothetical protein
VQRSRDKREHRPLARPQRVPKQINVHTDTTDFFRIDYDDVAILGGRPYLIRNNEREVRFGIDEQQKLWVKKAVDLTDGSTRIIKLTFHERFEANVGDLRFECFRSPQKEANILELVRNSNYFMQGFSVKDTGGDIVRILDFIKGKTFADYVFTIGKDHDDYYHNFFPGVLFSMLQIF